MERTGQRRGRTHEHICSQIMNASTTFCPNPNLLQLRVGLELEGSVARMSHMDFDGC